MTILGPPTEAQTDALRRSRRLRNPETLDTLGARLVRWKQGEWLGFQTLGGGWKLWALDANGRPRLDEHGKLRRFNVGLVSLVVSPALRERDGGPIPRLFDAEGESDLVAGIEVGLPHIVTSTGGAGSLAGHDRHREWLVGLHPAEVVVARDLDEAGRAGAAKVAAWWRERGVPVRVPVLPAELGEGGDLRDYLLGRPELNGKPATEPLGTAADLEELAAAAELRQPAPRNEHTEKEEQIHPDLETELQSLAELSPIEYDRQREAAAKRLRIRIATLDSEVTRRRPKDGAADETAGAPVLFEPIEPWSEPVDGRELLADLIGAIERFVVLDRHAAVAIALWILHAHAHDAAWISPILAIVSPQKRCGKTTLLILLQRLAPCSLPAANVTPAAIFRATEKWRPTLLVDEADSFLKKNEELRGILNSGHNRFTAQVVRTVGEDHEPRAFRTWAPKAIALIGALPETLEDRSIVISMRRRRADETIDELRGDRDYGFKDLARRCARWVVDHSAALGDADPVLPSALNDRARDNWRPLMAIAELLGEGAPAREAAQALSSDGDEDSIGTLLLGDIRDVFRDVFAARRIDRLSSKSLAEALVDLSDRPWSEWRRDDKPLSTNGLARLLRPFGVRTQRLRIDDQNLRGYDVASFEDAFSRYLPIHPDPSGTMEQVNENKRLAADATGTRPSDVPLENPEILNENRQCSSVPVEEGEQSEGGRDDGLFEDPEVGEL